MAYDAVLVLSFGGPDGPEAVRPFLANVTRGRDVAPARLEIAAGHYERFGGVSPINAANRALVAALQDEVDLPVYWGNRNWHPLLADTVRVMAADGITRAACFVTSAYGGYSSCRQYIEDIERARAEIGDSAPAIDKLRPFSDHPGFLDPMARNVARALATLDPAVESGAQLVFCAHSVPADQPGVTTYASQVLDASRSVADRIFGHRPWSVAWQSRSGRPGQPWLVPDLGEHLAALAAAGTEAVVVVPIGFVADHMEVVYDLDIEAAAQAASLGMAFARAATVGTDPAFVRMIRELIDERPPPCPNDCCIP